MSFVILHGAQFCVYLTLGDASLENTNLTLTSTQKGQPSHTYPKRREFTEITEEREVRELKFHSISLTNFRRSLWKNTGRVSYLQHPGS